MANLDNAPTDSSQEKSTELATILIRDIMIAEGGKPILDRRMRLRRLDVFPGGVIGVHSHENRPAILYVLSGSMTLYDNKREEPRVVSAGDAVTEFNDIKHYAVNNSNKDFLQLLTFDLLDD